jgi:hypothetical protein
MACYHVFSDVLANSDLGDLKCDYFRLTPSSSRYLISSPWYPFPTGSFAEGVLAPIMQLTVGGKGGMGGGVRAQETVREICRAGRFGMSKAEPARLCPTTFPICPRIEA